jgi:hypothetical protein
MAAKKPKAPKKFKQARKAAVADAKGAFTSGKTKAVRRDPMAKVSAEDKAVLSEVKKEAKAGYITDDRGNKVFSKPTETAAERMARDRRESKAAVDRMYAKEDAAAAKSAPAKATAPAASKPAAKKPAAKKPAAAKPKPGVKKPGVTRAAKSAANKAAWAKMSPAERKNWAANKGKVAGTGVKPTAPKTVATKPRIKTGVAAKGELTTAAQVDKYKAAVAAGKSKGEAVRIAKGGASNLPAVITKQGTKTVAKQAGVKAALATAGKTAAKGAWKVTGGKVGLALTAASLAAGPLFDALNKGAKKGSMPGGNQNMTTGRGGRPQGFVEDKKVLPKRPEGSYPKGGGKSLKIGPGGTTTDYKVEHGDTLSGIAKKAGVTLSELLAANKKIKDPRKIYRNTTVKIPNNKPAPKPMYTGPVPYVPGSKAAKAYEASRK